ncbi:MAG: adenylate/guanylate cyclase domain-containing protein [Nanoarchaeota archaeon]
MAEEKHYNTTIMFVDMAGYTARTSKLSRKELQEVLEEFEKVIKPAVSSFGGKIIKGMGDAFLITFHSPTNSVLCGIEIQKRIEDRNQKPDTKEKFEARVGISSGEVYERGGDIFGEPVNLASRVQSLAEKGQVVFSNSTFHAMNKNEFSIISLGKKSLKGISDKTEIYLAHEKGKSSGVIKTKAFLGKLKRKWWIALLILLVIIIISPKVPQELGSKWDDKALSSLEKENTRDMGDLLKVYESSPDSEKTFYERLLAGRMYLQLGKKESALEEFRKALSIADSRQIQELYSTLKSEGIDPSKLQTLSTIIK